MLSELIIPDELIAYIEKWKNRRGNLIMVLHAVQEHFGYVPRDICFTLSRMLEIPLAGVYEVLTFYNYFKLVKNAKYKILVCMGTACYLKGAQEVLKALKEHLDISEGQITNDGIFEIEKIRCLGCCALAPVISINGTVYGNLTKESVIEILTKCKNESC